MSNLWVYKLLFSMRLSLTVLTPQIESQSLLLNQSNLPWIFQDKTLHLLKSKHFCIFGMIIQCYVEITDVTIPRWSQGWAARLYVYVMLPLLVGERMLHILYEIAHFLPDLDESRNDYQCFITLISSACWTDDIRTSCKHPCVPDVQLLKKRGSTLARMVAGIRR